MNHQKLTQWMKEKIVERIASLMDFSFFISGEKYAFNKNIYVPLNEPC